MKGKRKKKVSDLTTAQRFAEVYARRPVPVPVTVPTTKTVEDRPPKKKSPPRKKKVAKKKLSEPTILVAWWPMRASATDVVVCGRKVELDGTSTEWHTSPITQRHSRRLVETKSGKRYQLHGPPSSKKNGRNDEDMHHHFRDGFPREWYAKVVSARDDSP